MSSTQPKNTQGLFTDRFRLITTDFIRKFDTTLHRKRVYRHTTDFFNTNHISVYPATERFFLASFFSMYAVARVSGTSRRLASV